jgi:hypothetical protein
VPSERVHYSDPAGLPGGAGLSDVTTTRGFELALVDTNRGPTSSLETGATDDFGVVVKAGRVRTGSSVVTGELVMLSFTGGLEGADIDTLDVPPGGDAQTVVMLIDLDPLESVLGVETITHLWVIDGSGGGEVDILEGFSLAVADEDGDGVLDGDDNCRTDANPTQLDTNLDGYGNACDADYTDDGVVGAPDFLQFAPKFGSASPNPLYDPEFDANGDGVIGAAEFLLLGRSFGGAPGPSGLACAGVIPCPGP